MKRSKVFLTVATGILAVAAFAASKAKHSAPAYVTTNNCTFYHNTMATTTPNAPRLKTGSSSSARTLYTQFCGQVLYQGA